MKKGIATPIEGNSKKYLILEKKNVSQDILQINFLTICTRALK